MSEKNASGRRDDLIVLASGILVAVVVAQAVHPGWLLGTVLFLGVTLTVGAVTAFVLRRRRR
jgi:hypothetical protein